MVAAKCDIFVGDWIPDPSGPFYTNDSCHDIEAHQNCMKNGRPDSGYLYWRWKPRDCELPKLDPAKFLKMMKDKSWAIIGDSISRNHVQSLLCILSKVCPQALKNSASYSYEKHNALFKGKLEQFHPVWFALAKISFLAI